MISEHGSDRALRGVGSWSKPCAANEGDAVLQLSVPYAYDFGKTMSRLRHIQVGQKLSAVWPMLFRAERQVTEFYNQSAYKEILHSSRAVGDQLLNVIKRLTSEQTGERIIDQYDVAALQQVLDRFDTAFESEMNVAPIYLVTEKGGLQIRDLISSPWNFFPDGLWHRVPGAREDMPEATRCIAFELNTAAAFHLHRINEAVLRRYWDVLTDGEDPPGKGAMGDYLATMDRRDIGDAKVRAALRDLKDLHRNPIAHPEQSLESTDDAIGLLGAIRATIVHMLKVIPASPEGDEENPDELAE